MNKCWALATMLLLAGCNMLEDRNPTTLRERQDTALRDPFNYSPYSEPEDISGGGTADFNKDAFKRDVNRVFNP